MLVVRERLSPEVGAVVRRALEAAADQLYRNAGDTAEAPNPGREQDTAAGGAATGVEQDSTACASASQRRADALRLVAEAALAADLDGGTAGDRYQVVVYVHSQALSAPPAGADVSCTDPAGLAARGESPASHRDRRCALLARREEGEYRQYATDEQRSQGGCSAGRMQPDYHHGLLAPASRSGARDQQSGAPVSQGSAGGQAVLEDGVYVPAETARRMACDAARVVMRHDRDGTVLDVGRKTRTNPPAIRRALAARDNRCRFPGCDCRHCDAHHVRHCVDGGATKLENLVLLCARHHRAVHEEGFTVELWDDVATLFFWPDGRPLPEAPSLPRWAGPPIHPARFGAGPCLAGVEYRLNAPSSRLAMAERGMSTTPEKGHLFLRGPVVHPGGRKLDSFRP